ncbi:hypothetical protein Q4543_21130 [Salipiger sp. 1_MG-2023]|uniref:hypothetical protein n=1 Tax=Salipiger sp. 1_MG-2023 TaxID=3062665 RepID=UPI0026E20645|nr:hypothetical protein [Salipiger sp. 1_MG-2023]MDO6588013.1 hypothetical protein [Salipiger sp. 1_MG-2023]
MKRFLTATALATVLGTSAFAASQAEVNAITQYYPEANFSALSDQQITQMMAIAQSGEDDNEKAARMERIAAADSSAGRAMPSEAEQAAIRAYYPDVNFAALSQSQVAEMMAIAQSGDEDTEKSAMIEEIAAADNPNVDTADMLILTDYFPQVRIEEMTTAEKDRIVALVNRGVDPDSIRVQLLDGMNEAAPNLTPSEISAVQQLVPEADLRVLTTEQVNRLRAALYGEDKDTEQRQLIEQVLGS